MLWMCPTKGPVLPGSMACIIAHSELYNSFEHQVAANSSDHESGPPGLGLSET